jgi:hypothetical protein
MRAPSLVDRAVLEVVQQELAAYGDVAELRHVWGESPAMWFVEVQPVNDRAAPMRLAFDGHDLLNVNVAATWFEVFPFGEDSLDYLRGVVRAVLAGHVEEAKTWGDAFGRLYTETGIVKAGHVHWPWPWAWRPVRRYEPYGERVTLG